MTKYRTTKTMVKTYYTGADLDVNTQASAIDIRFVDD